mgnify:CR=1 FL=1|tara:strand:- start:990 stop:2003 length:1014 start_codon:yes stop_codon:yes gene_type:complete
MIDIYGLGNAIVDTEYRVSEDFLDKHDVAKGHMTLIDEFRLRELTQVLNEHAAEKTSGGSAANTIFAAQSFGSSTYYSCKVSADNIGAFFLQDLREAGIEVSTNQMTESKTSGQCLVFITPDGERSMNTCLGVSDQLTINDIDGAKIAASRYLYLEGYLSSSVTATETAAAARAHAEESKVKTVITLSDPSIVQAFRANLELMLGNGVDHLFCNEEEALTWTKTDRLDIAANELSDVANTLNITLGAKGSLFAQYGRQTLIPAFTATPVDTNGAGDIYAGANIHGWCLEMDPIAAARFGNLAASSLIGKYGARFKHVSDYKELLSRFNSEHAVRNQP